MGNSDSCPSEPEEAQSLRQTITFDRLENKLQNMIADTEAFKVHYVQEIFDLKTEMKKKDELQRETERTLNEVRRELEEKTEQNRKTETELKRLKAELAAKDIEEIRLWYVYFVVFWLVQYTQSAGVSETA